MHDCLYVCMYVCMHECMYFVDAWMLVFMCACMHVCMCFHMYIGMCGQREREMYVRIDQARIHVQRGHAFSAHNKQRHTRKSPYIFTYIHTYINDEHIKKCDHRRTPPKLRVISYVPDLVWNDFDYHSVLVPTSVMLCSASFSWTKSTSEIVPGVSISLLISFSVSVWG